MMDSARLLRLRTAACCVVVSLTIPAVGWAQTAGAGTATSAVAADYREAAEPLAKNDEATSSFSEAVSRDRSSAGFWSPFRAIPDDFARFFRSETMTVVGLGGVSAAAVHEWDVAGMSMSRKLRPALFAAGNTGGSFFVQAGASFGLYAVGRMSGWDRASSLGADLVRAQVLVQGLVQAGKFATRRARPDASNNMSLPSGHTASAVAAATVLQRHFGWKAGIPAYGFGAYVAASRMAANKHHLSDVVMGAVVGIAAGRSIRVTAAGTRFEVGVAPASGGAAVTFTTR